MNFIVNLTIIFTLMSHLASGLDPNVRKKKPWWKSIRSHATLYCTRKVHFCRLVAIWHLLSGLWLSQFDDVRIFFVFISYPLVCASENRKMSREQIVKSSNRCAITPLIWRVSIGIWIHGSNRAIQQKSLPSTSVDRWVKSVIIRRPPHAWRMCRERKL